MTQNLETTAEKAVLTISDLQSHLDDQETFRLKTPNEVAAGDHMEALKEAVILAGRYKEEGALETLSPIQVKEDLIRVASLNINVAEMAGTMASRVQVGEDAIKLSRAKTHLALKEIKETLINSGKKVQATEKDIEAAARIRSEDIQELVSNDRITCEYTKFVYYAVQEFGRILQTASNRMLFAEDNNVRLS